MLGRFGALASMVLSLAGLVLQDGHATVATRVLPVVAEQYYTAILNSAILQQVTTEQRNTALLNSLRMESKGTSIHCRVALRCRATGPASGAGSRVYTPVTNPRDA